MQILHQTDHNKAAWDELVWAVRTGGNPFEKTHDGLSEFEWLKLDPREEDKFSKAMKQVDSMGTLPFYQAHLVPHGATLLSKDTFQAHDSGLTVRHLETGCNRSIL